MAGKIAAFFVLGMSLCILAGCSPRVSLFGDPSSEPLRQSVLEGKGRDKVLVLPVSGFISAGSRGVVLERPGLVQELTSILRKAREDKEIKALLLLIDSPGGTVTGADLLAAEVDAYKEATGVKVVAQAMTLCASGGYYLALCADEIVATPASLVGSVGTVFISPRIAGLLDKIGVEAEVTKSGDLKDMGSPFRPSTAEERKLTQDMIGRMNALFLERLDAKRKLSPENRADVARAGVYTGTQAVSVGLADRVGYPRDAIARARELAGISPDAKVVVYRRFKCRDDTYYNTATALAQPAPEGFRLGLDSLGVPTEAGFYYLWPQAATGYRQ